MNRLMKASLYFFGGSFCLFALMLGLLFLANQLLGERNYGSLGRQFEPHISAPSGSTATGAKVLFIGDGSGPLNVDAARIANIENFSIPNSTTIENYYLLRRLLRNGAKPNCIVASYSFQWERSRKFFWTEFVQSGFYSDEEIAEIERTRRFLGESKSDFLGSTTLYAARQVFSDIANRFQKALHHGEWNDQLLKIFRPIPGDQRDAAMLSEFSTFERSKELSYPKGPNATRTELEYLDRTLALSRERKIAFYFLYVPFATTVPIDKAFSYRESYERLIEGRAGPFRFLAPPPMPDHYYLRAGHWNLEGTKAAVPAIQDGLRNCFR